MTAEELHERINQKGLNEEWAKIVLERFGKSLDKKKVGKTHELANSLKQTTTEEMVTFYFRKYGKFVDMGVGRGMKFSNAKDMRGINARALGIIASRKPKKWYSPVMWGQLIKLAELIASKYGRESANFIKSEMIKFPFIIEL